MASPPHSTNCKLLAGLCLGYWWWAFIWFLLFPFLSCWWYFLLFHFYHLATAFQLMPLYQISLGIIYGIELIVVVISTAIATGTDPTATQLENIPPGSFQYQFLLLYGNLTPNHLFAILIIISCIFCTRRVPSKSKHCRKCDRCADGFDHHCKVSNWDVLRLHRCSYLFFLPL